MAPSTPGTSSAPKESSVLFSLSELMDLESERIAVQESARLEAERAAQSARDLEEHRLRCAEEERLRLAEDERRRADFERREEAARLLAIAHAEVERVRHDAENELRLRVLAQSQEHEQKLLRIREDRAKKQLRRLVIASLFVAATAAVGGYLWVDAAKRSAQVRLAQMELEVLERRRNFDRQIQDLTEKMNRLGALDASKRERMKREVEALMRQKAQSQPPPKPHEQKNGPRKALPTPPPPPPRCPEGDPMCPL